jgi:putative transposase
MEYSDIKPLKELERENRRLKQMYADLSLENRALKDVIEKNSNTVAKEGNGNFYA